MSSRIRKGVGNFNSNDKGNGHSNQSLSASDFIPLFPSQRFVSSGGVTMCTVHRTFASRCGCLDGLSKAKIVTKKPSSPLVRCHRCLCLTNKLTPFAVPWSVAFVEGAVDLLGKGLCDDCYASLFYATKRSFVRFKFPLVGQPARPAWSVVAERGVSSLRFRCD